MGTQIPQGEAGKHLQQWEKWLTASTDETRHAVLTILKPDQRFTICEIFDLLIDEHSIEVSQMIVQCILAAEGYMYNSMWKIGTQWVDWWE